jgi:hypothetical protein
LILWAFFISDFGCQISEEFKSQPTNCGMRFLVVSKTITMDNRNNPEGSSRNPDPGKERRQVRNDDLPDSPGDREKLKSEETFIDLPDVKDIPGQEFVNAPPAGMLGDTTVASDDEEGRSVFDRDDSEDLRRTGDDSDVTRDERSALSRTDYMPTKDEDNLVRATMDNTDNEGESLNERGFGDERAGRDLDVPGSDLDDRNERIGEEDEENNDYSLGGDENDMNEGRP